MSLLWVACISAPFVEEDEWRFKDTLLLAVSFPFLGDGGACFMSCCLWIKLLPQCQLCASQCTATAAAKSLQSCPTLCDPIDGSPPGSPIPGILQARTLEWVAISFFNAWKWKVKVKSLSLVRLLETPWTAAYQAPPSMGFSRQEYWSGVPLPSLHNVLITDNLKILEIVHVIKGVILFLSSSY